MIRRVVWLFAAWLLLAGTGVHAHAMPNSLLLVDVGDSAVAVDATLPWAELKYALPPDMAEPPRPLTHAQRTLLTDYVASHFGAAAPGGGPWAMRVDSLKVLDSPDHADLGVHLTLTPPPGVSTSDFVLRDSAIIHLVMSHVALVFARDVSKDAPPNAEHRMVGGLRNPAFTLEIRRTEPAIRGFGSAFLLGMRHIAGGLDHLLFLVTLLLPAPLLASGGRWTGPRPAKAALLALASTVTAFTVGHSITLVLGAALDIRIPQQPVEVAIAASILVAALAAWRPPGEGRAAPLVAGVFGLIHGMAFSAVLSEQPLAPVAKAQAIAGFNLGIEAVQMLIVLLLAPGLILAARTPAYRWVRLTGAVAAGVAAIVWMAARLTLA